MGTPEFARVILEALWEAGYPIVGVAAQPDKPAGRGQQLLSPPVARFAIQKQLLLMQPPKIRGDAVLSQIQNLAPDYIIVAAYGKILPPKLLKIPKRDCLNVHASLLPQYRGAAPVNHALLDDKKETGVCLMRVVPELDAGPVFLAESLSIHDDDDAKTLTGKLSQLGSHALLKALPLIESGAILPLPQESQKATHAAKLSREMSVISWQDSSRKIFNTVRALVPWPVAETLVHGKRLRIYSSDCLPQGESGAPGEIVHIGQWGITVATGQGHVLLKSVQLEGKKRMPAFDVANGLRLECGVKLGL